MPKSHENSISGYCAGCFPGTTVETSKLEKNSSRVLFGGIFATGGITLSQVTIMTGLEYYLIQNWVKRGFVSSPKKRVYTKEQFARIVLINMLRETLVIEKICELIEPLTSLGVSEDKIYHAYVDMIADGRVSITDKGSAEAAAKTAAEALLADADEGTKKRAARIFEAMLYAHSASMLRDTAEKLIATIS